MAVPGRWRSAVWIVLVSLTAGVLPAVVNAQFYYFGRNKVQWTDFEWHILKTDHFEIYYYKGMEDLAQQGATYAEEAYRELEGKFNHNVLQPVPLIFYSSHLHFEQTNTTAGFIPEGVGGFFEFLKGRVVIPSDGSPYQFRRVIRHELVHVFMHSKISRVLIDHRQVQDHEPPLWFTEGLAEYWSGPWDTQAEMVMRDAVVSGYVRPLADMDEIYGTFLMYKEGQNVCATIARKYGEEKLLLLMENFWKAPSFSEVMRLTLGRTYEEFDKEWIYELRKQYYPRLASDDLPGRVSVELAAEGFNSKPVVVGDTARQVYYIGNHRGYTSIYRLNPDEEKPKSSLVIEGEQSSDLEAFHPFQSRMAVSRDKVLAFVTKAGETDVLHLYDLNSESMKEDLRFRSLVVIGSPTWSPDGSKIAFSSIDVSGRNDLYIFDLSSRSLLRLTDDIYDDRDPSWSPDGRWIAFSSDRGADGRSGFSGLCLYSLDRGTIECLTTGRRHDVSPSWSPDGKMLAFCSDMDGAQNIWLLPMNAGHIAAPARRITNYLTAAFDPAWGGKNDIVFTAFEKFSFQIRRLDDVSARFDSSRATFDPPVPEPVAPWTVASLEGLRKDATRPYERDYTLDIAQSQISTDPVFGTTGGAALAMSDVLGNDQYYFLIYNTAQTQSELLDNFNIAITRMSLGKRTNYAYGVFRLAGNRYDLTDPDIYYYERSYGAYFVLSYPLSQFKRVESGITVSNSEKDNYMAFTPRHALLVSDMISFVWDNSLWGPTGPMDGNRMKVELAYTSDVMFSNVSYYTLLADYRAYFRLSTRTAFASRVNLWYNEGKEARRFFMGGSWDLRGWDRWSIRGMKQWLASEELRFPLVDELAIRFPFGTMSLGSFRGALFADAGGSWDDEYIDTKGSVGAGIRFNLFGALVLRYDIGKRIEENFSRFQKGLFYQFFFGWDF